MKSISEILMLLNPITFKNYSFTQQMTLVTTFKILSEFWAHQLDKMPLLENSSNYSSQLLAWANQNNSYRYENEISPTQAQQRASQRNFSWRKRKKTLYIVYSPLIQTTQLLALVSGSTVLCLCKLFSFLSAPSLLSSHLPTILCSLQ